MLVFPAPEGAVIMMSFPVMAVNEMQIKETNANHSIGFKKGGGRS